MKVKDLNGTVELDTLTNKKQVKQNNVTEGVESFDTEIDVTSVNKDFTEVKHKSNIDLSKFYAFDFKSANGSRYIQKGSYFEEK